jgi:tetratricopeptide (TPR) repeat protein
MSQALYEQYKEALRRGHVAAVRGRLDVAEAAYRTAAAIAPDRALPYVSLAGVLRRRDRPDEALVAYAAALVRIPGDEGALRGRAELHADAGRRSAAAADLDALSLVLERAGRLGEALEAAARALDLAESRSRRRDVDRLRAQGDTAAAEAGTGTAAVAVPPKLGAPDGPAPIDDEPVGASDRPGREPPVGSTTPDVAPPDAGAGSPPEQGPDPPAEPAPISVPAPPPEPAVLRAVADALLDSGDLAGATERYLALAAQYRSESRYDAAMDACLALLASSPSNHRLQLEIAAIQAERGWLDTAAEKVRLLARLADLDEDGDARAAVAAFAAGRGFGPPSEPSAGG